MRGPLTTTNAHRSPHSRRHPYPSRRGAPCRRPPPSSPTGPGRSPQPHDSQGGGLQPKPLPRKGEHLKPFPLWGKLKEGRGGVLPPLPRRPLRNRPSASSTGGAERSCLFSQREEIEMRGPLTTTTGYRSPPTLAVSHPSYTKPPRVRIEASPLPTTTNAHRSPATACPDPGAGRLQPKPLPRRGSTSNLSPSGGN